MLILFDGRVLSHKKYTGVENYTKKIYEFLKNDKNIKIDKPNISNKYLSHLWLHFILPFKKFDTLFCPANIAPIFLPKSKKLVFTLHDISFLTYSNTFSSVFGRYYRFLVPYNIKRAQTIITVSNYSKEQIEKYYPYSKGKVKVIYHGIDSSFRKLENIKKENQILYVGSLNKRKNFLGVIKAFELINDSSFELLLVGDFSDTFSLDDESINLIEKARNNPKIKFLSNINNKELIELYNKSKVLLFPSFYEGFGFPILEAFACGTAVITSNTSSLPEVGKDAAIYCNPTNIEEIAERLKEVLYDDLLQKEMIKKGLEVVLNFTWEKSIIEHKKILNKEYN